MQPIDLPVHLDDPKYFLLFTLEDFGIFIGCMAIGLVLHEMGYTLLAGIGVSYLSSRFRGAIPEGRLQHIAYWHGFAPASGHCLINPYARKFIG